MEKNGKEPQTNKHRSNLVMKVLLAVLCVVVVVQFAVAARNVASLNDLKKRAERSERAKDFGPKTLEKRETRTQNKTKQT